MKIKKWIKFVIAVLTALAAALGGDVVNITSAL